MQPQLVLNVPKSISDGKAQGKVFRDAIYQFIPSSGKVRREEVLEKASGHLGLPLKKARSDLNRIIADERRAGRLELDSGWESVWRV